VVEYEKEGLVFKKIEDRIVRISYSQSREAWLGQLVVSTGRGGILAGRQGIVVELSEPGTSEHQTGKIVRIWWENDDYPTWMAFEDFRSPTAH
jgi:hypothetical protein